MLQTNRLILRKAKAQDTEDIHLFMSDPQAMAYWSTPPHPDLETTRAQVMGMVRAKPPLTYFVFEHDTRIIGMGGLHSGNEIGFMLHPTFWRQGFVREAMNILLPHVWSVTNHDHVFADADPRNLASIGLLRALGFHETHRAQNTYCVNGEWSDSVYFRLNRPTS